MLVGESWFVHEIHVAGFDSFTVSRYGEGGVEFVATLTEAGHQVQRVPSHTIATQFPKTAEELTKMADVIVLSDVGVNSFALTPDTFARGMIVEDRIVAIREFVRAGGGLMMAGGYTSFSGIDAKARWGHSALAEVLPVAVLDRDDRVESTTGLIPHVVGKHPIVDGLEPEWPPLLGLNEVVPKPESTTLATADDYPLITVGEFGKGRTAAFTSDIAKHWAPAQFTTWQGYGKLFDNTIRWLSGA